MDDEDIRAKEVDKQRIMGEVQELKAYSHICQIEKNTTENDKKVGLEEQHDQMRSYQMCQEVESSLQEKLFGATQKLRTLKEAKGMWQGYLSVKKVITISQCSVRHSCIKNFVRVGFPKKGKQERAF